MDRSQQLSGWSYENRKLTMTATEEDMGASTIIDGGGYQSNFPNPPKEDIIRLPRAQEMPLGELFALSDRDLVFIARSKENIQAHKHIVCPFSSLIAERCQGQPGSTVRIDTGYDTSTIWFLLRWMYGLRDEEPELPIPGSQISIESLIDELCINCSRRHAAQHFNIQPIVEPLQKQADKFMSLIMERGEEGIARLAARRFKAPEEIAQVLGPEGEYVLAVLRNIGRIQANTAASHVLMGCQELWLCVVSQLQARHPATMEETQQPDDSEVMEVDSESDVVESSRGALKRRRDEVSSSDDQDGPEAQRMRTDMRTNEEIARAFDIDAAIRRDEEIQRGLRK